MEGNYGCLQHQGGWMAYRMCCSSIELQWQIGRDVARMSHKRPPKKTSPNYLHDQSGQLSPNLMKEEAGGGGGR